MRRDWHKFAAAVAAALLLLAPAVAWAAEAHGGEEKVDILSPRLDLGIWTIVVFVVLYLVMRYVKLPGAPAPAFVMMMEGLRKREERIRSALEESQRAREDAQKLRTQLQGELDQASERVRQMLDQARQDTQRTTDEMLAKARGEIQAERERLHREMELARDQALQQLWSQAARLATMVSAKVIRRQLSEEDHRRLVDEAINDLRADAAH